MAKKGSSPKVPSMEQGMKMGQEMMKKHMMPMPKGMDKEKHMK